MSGVVVFWIGAAVKFHDTLHGLRSVRGNGTALKAKLIQKLASMRGEVLYEFLLDLIKSYNSLHREQCMEILVGYNIRPRM